VAVTVDQLELAAFCLALLGVALVGYGKIRFAMTEPTRQRFHRMRLVTLIGAICAGLALAGSLAGLA
jgi:hypothetical protein